MVTRDVTLKGLVRVAGDIGAAWRKLPTGRELAPVLERQLSKWAELTREFRREGFYERFPARGQVERVDKIRRRLARAAGLGE